jgi:hypothetical protein
VEAWKRGTVFTKFLEQNKKCVFLSFFALFFIYRGNYRIGEKKIRLRKTSGFL